GAGVLQQFQFEDELYTWQPEIGSLHRDDRRAPYVSLNELVSLSDACAVECSHGTTATILGMPWLRLQVVLLAPLLLAANGQCVMACASELCRDSATPPCHRHHPSKSKSGGQSCAHAVLVAVGRAPITIEVRPAPSVFILAVERLATAVP